MAETIKVGIADYNICKSPDKITTIGLGSCVGVVLYDESKKVAGLLHVMLPDSTKIRDNSKKTKFADSGIDLLLESLNNYGLRTESLKAKIAGGAKMFEFSGKSSLGSVGEKNVEAIKRILAEKHIPIISEDIGKNYGRTIIFDPVDCSLVVKQAGNISIII